VLGSDRITDGRAHDDRDRADYFAQRAARTSALSRSGALRARASSRGVSALSEAAHERRKLISGTAQDREQVLDEADHGGGMSAQHEHKAYDDDPADSPAHGYRSCPAACIPLPAAIRAAAATARWSVLAPVAFALGSKLMQATYPQAPNGLVCPPRTAAMQARVGLMAGGSDTPA